MPDAARRRKSCVHVAGFPMQARDLLRLLELSPALGGRADGVPTAAVGSAATAWYVRTIVLLYVL